MIRLVTLAAPLLAALLAGCGPFVSQVSTPPPMRTAKQIHVPFSEDVVHVSKGVAIAFDCVDPWSGDACEAKRMKVADPSVARVMPAHLERDQSPRRRISSREGLVLIGLKAGETTLSIESDAGETTLSVIVE